ncbi:hypothetical protein C5Y93_28655 [Blastopirellula marina]|uniref:Uncharacterized protein n=1 Tax=Blastopirellula marina TaxID=124 RepID=A0A2S8GDJ1_9BACT|nr:hypothetical protein C5Y93_28655 [Blastopirellula marina]
MKKEERRKQPQWVRIMVGSDHDHSLVRIFNLAHFSRYFRIFFRYSKLDSQHESITIEICDYF